MKIAILVVVGAVLVGGCGGGYRVVKKTPSGGEVALIGVPEKAREQANDYMAAQCPAGFDIVEEGEAVVGSTTTARSSSSGKNLLGQPTQTTNADSSDKREWRIKFQCKGTTAQPPGQPSAAIQEFTVVF